MTHLHNPYASLHQDQLGQEVHLDPHLQASTQEKIESLLKSSPIILFMKGNAQGPQCGFSANSVRILNSFQKPFKTFDILKSPEIRQGLKDYSQWPTYPQLYIQGQLIGGNDIIQEMMESGELAELLNSSTPQ